MQLRSETLAVRKIQQRETLAFPHWIQLLFTHNLSLWLILFIAWSHGLVYVFAVPPWQHYDEPGHFEYVWMLAHHPYPVGESEIDLGMRSSIVDSMQINRFFDLLKIEPAWLGISQFVDPPLYHLVASVPVRWFPQLDVTTQLYLMRLVSLVFLLLSIYAAWGAAAELTPPGHPARWMVPIFLALLPGYVDLMTAVNNDTAAVALCSLFFWMAVRILKRGWHWPSVAALLAVTVLAFFTKKTIWSIVLFVPLVLVLALVPPRRRWIVWASVLVLGIVSLVALFESGDAAFWYRKTNQAAFTRSEGSPVFQIPAAIQLNPVGAELPAVWQHLPSQDTLAIQGKTVTVGGWVWASQPTRVDSMGVTYPSAKSQEYLGVFSRPVEISTTPAFFSFEVQIPERVTRVMAVLMPYTSADQMAESVYYSGLFMIEGRCSLGEVPRFSKPDGSEGTWCGKAFRNIIRNGNAVDTWPVLRGALFNQPWMPVKRDTFTDFLAYVLDRSGFDWYDRLGSSQLFQTFWGKFSWGNVTLLGGSAPYVFLMILTGWLLCGALLGLVRHWKALNTDLLFPLTFGLLGWSTAVVAGIYFGGATGQVVIPVARYAYPVIVPTTLLLVLGGNEWFKWIGRKIPTIQSGESLLYLALLFSLDLYALLSILYYYYWTGPT